jgi:hypothetical protein
MLSLPYTGAQAYLKHACQFLKEFTANYYESRIVRMLGIRSCYLTLVLYTISLSASEIVIKSKMFQTVVIERTEQKSHYAHLWDKAMP